MAKGRWFGAAAGVTAGAAIALLWRQYLNRPLHRVPNMEGLDDQAVADAYGRISAMPQMALLRLLVARPRRGVAVHRFGSRHRLRAGLPGRRAGAAGA